ncbi:SAGA complex subunit Sgf73 [Ophidiomyces ophidiicola]|uniref:SAGA complex subunit Sgf73 n=1 Tax=Ophidiomyces ophidiicola TaxID=1387563 RepID=A0ACB8UYW4_9EURO|nr:SAGA complex subunit Sgf73 [Ophidiomyces ophidiicola]KAI1930311.1 SAGA complex subunit Sgf73 [Ophidiomyces ophidiicola]KAI1975620.1 SAGA complex subunit Sgf73 [Ophidiomyces ophidiicola]KAI2033825.1 SAGA complex subunit Sgf73 [Ophidiomyces ophidiicola]KAI2084313.1 SAGA complex subunit Sgf73 [Ophidiomyces ophidiicola]
MARGTEDSDEPDRQLRTMASNGRGSSVASGSEASFVDASGYKYSEKNKQQTKIKLKKTASNPTNGTKGAESGNADSSAASSPILPMVDEKTMASFPTGKPRETPLETVICKHCKRPVLKQSAIEHIRGCLKAKQEKARKKKEARDANRAKEKADKEGNDDDGDGAMKGQKSAKKNAGEDGPKKGKKRKAEDDDKEPKRKKKKDEPKPKVPKPKGPVDVEKQCGVILPNGGQCARSLTCKSHSMGAKRAVPGRSLPYDMLLQAYQKKNQARQQSRFRTLIVIYSTISACKPHVILISIIEAAIDANAPVHDDLDGNGPVDSDEEKDAVMAGILRSRPQPLVTHSLIPTRRKYHLVRMKEMLSQVFGSGNFFGSPDNSSQQGRNPFQSEPTTIPSPVPGSAGDGPSQQLDPSRKPLPQHGLQNRNNTPNAPVKRATTGTSIS